MSANPIPASDDPVEAAASWHVLMQSEEVAAEQRTAFEIWRQDPLNARAYQRFETLWRRFDAAESTPARQAAQQLVKTRRPAAGPLLSLLLALATSGYLLSDTETGAFVLATHKSLHGYSQTITLPDSSQMILGPMSAVDLEYSDEYRTIRLVRGEVTLNVASDAARPLRVVSDHGTAQALGTRFQVLKGEEASTLRVTESRVELCAQSVTECMRLSAGQQVRFTEQNIGPVRAIDAAFQIDPISRTLIVEDQPVLRVLDVLRLHHPGVIKLDRAALQGLKVSGVYPLDDARRALEVLASSVPVKVQRYTSLFITIKRDG